MNPYIKEQLKDLTDDNIQQKLGELISSIKSNYADNNQTELLFIYHNRLFPNQQEHTKSCSSCRERVYNRLKEYNNKNINQE